MSASSLRGQVRTWYLTCRTPMADTTWAIGFGAPSLLTDIEKRGVGKDHVFLCLGCSVKRRLRPVLQDRGSEREPGSQGARPARQFRRATGTVRAAAGEAARTVPVA